MSFLELFRLLCNIGCLEACSVNVGRLELGRRNTTAARRHKHNLKRYIMIACVSEKKHDRPLPGSEEKKDVGKTERFCEGSSPLETTPVALEKLRLNPCRAALPRATTSYLDLVSRCADLTTDVADCESRQVWSSKPPNRGTTVLVLLLAVARGPWLDTCSTSPLHIFYSDSLHVYTSSCFLHKTPLRL